MKQVVFYQTGLPEEVLQLEEAPMPEPRAHEVRIRVTARNINPSDIMFIRGMYGITPKLPSSAGFEAVGIVDKSDEKGSIPVGTKVIFTAIGTWKEYVCVPSHMVIPSPAGMPDEVACQAFVNPLTAYGMLESSGLKEGQWLLVTAAASAYGKLVIQMAKQKGIKVACTVRRDEQKEILVKLGADLVINTEKEKLQKVIMEQTQEGVDVVFDAVGGVLGARALASLKTGGKMMVFGLLSLENIPLNSGLLIFKNLKVEGFWLTTWMAGLSPEETQKAFKTVFSHLLSQKIKVDVEATFPLEQFREALAAYEKEGRNGKIILTS
ncbi:zinc-dependent alcohol dehydrogenase family protein [Cecembia calidifontis]|uniref:NADPH:quinone reductase-like Zn-dependent oxidoreductase n=1 Tax=Cecembia calidifontis TaxID=1187080 RepID=A0A4Q7PB31_9BACT|nr:zinc-dependent alcohol dehydrogenase family protein [Cecembia calidifontis]RZS97395.1 NADPH:quinone reductase-like Zn-dependent oxidoreductase [Cecembia calidifontis]